jgi:hypothetical protein
MNNQAFFDTLAVIMILVSLGMLAQGLRISTGKPFLLHTWVYLAVIVLMFVLPMVASFTSVWPLDWQSVLITLLIYAILIPVLVLGTRRSMGDIVVYNATETMIREALEEVLDEYNLAYSEGPPPGLLSRIYAGLYGQTKFSLVLKGLNSTIHMTSNPLGNVTLRFTKKRAIPNYKGLIVSLDNKLQIREFDGSRFPGRLAIFGSVLMMGVSIWLLLT